MGCGILEQNKDGKIMNGIKPAIRMVGVTKTFPGTIAVDRVDFSALFGEVHAIVGENGAGKSTLMKILAGSFRDYGGEIYLEGKRVDLFSYANALRHGIGMIYQELSLARPISIAENLLVNNLPLRLGFWVKKSEMYESAQKRLQRVGLELDPFLNIEEISQHEAQLVEIAKVLGNNPRIIVMDEPTSSLSRDEVERLFCIINTLKEQNLSIIYISHHLEEIFTIADRVTVLRDGKRIATKNISEVTPEELAQMMLGKEIGGLYDKKVSQIGNIVLEVKNLTRYGFFHNVSLELKEREVLGIAGLTGSGRTELMCSIAGLDPVDFGAVKIRDREIKLRSYLKAIKEGIIYLTEDRKTQGLFLRLQVDENIVSAILPRVCRLGFYIIKKGTDIVKRMIGKLKITPENPEVELTSLSGGNQQKALFGKWLVTESSIYFLDEPTRGVDVGAKATIHGEILALTEKGSSVIIVSSDIPELSSLCDRIIVMREGKITGEIEAESINERNILLAITGKSEKYVSNTH